MALLSTFLCFKIDSRFKLTSNFAKEWCHCRNLALVTAKSGLVRKPKIGQHVTHHSQCQGVPNQLWGYSTSNQDLLWRSVLCFSWFYRPWFWLHCRRWFARNVSLGKKTHGLFDLSLGSLALGCASMSPEDALGGIIEAKNRDDFTDPRTAG